jgi:multidrug efflux pump
MVQVNLTASTSLHTLEEFRNLVIKQSTARHRAAEGRRQCHARRRGLRLRGRFRRQAAVYIGIQVAPSANLLDVIKGVRTVFPEIQAQLPHGLNGEIVYDSTEFVNSSISEVSAPGRGAD